MDSTLRDQQPIAKTVGQRVPPPVGAPPTAEARAAWSGMAAFRTCVPKGVFTYASHDEMTRDRERWEAEAVARRAR
ncbi:MAG TPA: hypothetical protein VEL09_10130 [Burkholderiales bacterium]|nr:hypothetical protein [Burkholderiales bacterium]